MTFADLRSLVILSLKDPAEVARRILAMNLGREVMWTGLLLTAVLNTMMQVLTGLFLPPAPPEMDMFNISATIYFALLAGGLLVTGGAISRVGRALGGTGGFTQIMLLLIWLQFLRVLALIGVLFLAVAMPILSPLAALAMGLWGLYIMLHFIDQAHGLGSVLRAGGVLFASVLAVALGIFILLQLLV